MAVFEEHEMISLVDTTGRVIGRVLDVQGNALGKTLITAELTAPNPTIVSAGLEEVTQDELDLEFWKAGLFKQSVDDVLEVLKVNGFVIRRVVS